MATVRVPPLTGLPAAPAAGAGVGLAAAAGAVVGAAAGAVLGLAAGAAVGAAGAGAVVAGAGDDAGPHAATNRLAATASGKTSETLRIAGSFHEPKMRTPALTDRGVAGRARPSTHRPAS